MNAVFLAKKKNEIKTDNESEKVCRPSFGAFVIRKKDLIFTTF